MMALVCIFPIITEVEHLLCSCTVLYIFRIFYSKVVLYLQNYYKDSTEYSSIPN